MNINHRIDVTAAERDDFLTVGDLRDALFSSEVPPEAKVVPILRERGSQRDPVTVLVGLTITWTTG